MQLLIWLWTILHASMRIPRIKIHASEWLRILKCIHNIQIGCNILNRKVIYGSTHLDHFLGSLSRRSAGWRRAWWLAYRCPTTGRRDWRKEKSAITMRWNRCYNVENGRFSRWCWTSWNEETWHWCRVWVRFEFVVRFFQVSTNNRGQYINWKETGKIFKKPCHNQFANPIGRIWNV